MSLLGFGLLMGLMYWYEWVCLSRSDSGRGELIAFSVLMAVSLGLGCAMILELPIPNPTKFLEFLLKPLTMPS